MPRIRLCQGKSSHFWKDWQTFTEKQDDTSAGAPNQKQGALLEVSPAAGNTQPSRRGMRCQAATLPCPVGRSRAGPVAPGHGLWHLSTSYGVWAWPIAPRHGLWLLGMAYGSWAWTLLPGHGLWCLGTAYTLHRGSKVSGSNPRAAEGTAGCNAPRQATCSSASSGSGVATKIGASAEMRPRVRLTLLAWPEGLMW